MHLPGAKELKPGFSELAKNRPCRIVGVDGRTSGTVQTWHVMSRELWLWRREPAIYKEITGFLSSQFYGHWPLGDFNLILGW